MHKRKSVILSLFFIFTSSFSFAQSIEKIDFKSREQKLFSSHRLQAEWLKAQKKYAKLIRRLTEDHPEVLCKSLLSAGKYSLSSQCFHGLKLKGEYTEHFLTQWRSLDEKILKLLSKNERESQETQVELWTEALSEEVALLDSLIGPSPVNLVSSEADADGVSLKDLNRQEFGKKFAKKASQKKQWIQKHVPRYGHIRPKKDRDLHRVGHNDPLGLMFASSDLKKITKESFQTHLTAEELEEIAAIHEEIDASDLLEGDVDAGYEDDGMGAEASAASADSSES